MRFFVATIGSLILAAATCSAAEPETDVFAKVGDRELALDLHRPEKSGKVPLIVYVHGGAWRSGSREQMPLGDLVRAGFAIASVDYRLTPEAPFPANVHDIKAAIRYLRAHSEKWNLATDRIAIAGSSAGGHLAALVGLTNGHPDLEGKIGDHPGQKSDIAAVVSFYGASNLTTILSQSTAHGLKVRVPALTLLFGGPVEEKAEPARLASPVFHIDRSDPPVLLIHGDQDPQMPIEQSRELAEACRKAGVPVRFDTVVGGLHGGEGFYTGEQLHTVAEFLRGALQP
jgi:acetyl esterase/lipase